MFLELFSRIPYSTEQGIFSTKQGIILHEQGKGVSANREHARLSALALPIGCINHRRPLDRRGRPMAAAQSSDGRPRNRPASAPRSRPRRSRSGNAGGIDQRRQDSEQDEFGRELDGRQVAGQRERDAGDNQEDRRSRVEPAGRNRYDHEDGEQEEDCLDGRGHWPETLYRQTPAAVATHRQKPSCAVPVLIDGNRAVATFFR